MRAVSRVLTKAGSLGAMAALLAACGGDPGTLSDPAAAEAQAGSSPGAPPGDKADCRRWQTCTPENACHTGWVTGCRAGEPICTDIGGWLPNGSGCGQDQVCYMGECQPCAAGSGCTPDSGPCHLGAIACSTGLPVCQDTGALAANGTSCGQDQVCYYGSCNWCASGWDCTPWDSCAVSRTDCSQGWQQCLPTGEQRPDGTQCGPFGVCRTGACEYCPWYYSCTPANPCLSGYVDCSTGTQVCVEMPYPLPDGTPCGDGNVCQQGVCLPPGCTPGADCTPPGQCFAWAVDCSSGAAVCNQTSTPLPNGTSCGEALACMTGQCVPAREVRGTAAFTYWDADGPIGQLPRGIYSARALVPDGSGGHAAFEGQIQGSSFVIPGVPQGTYLLNVQVQGRVPDLIETSAGDFDLGADWMGRADAVIPSLSTPVTFDVDGLVPWNAQDRLELVSAGAGDFFPVFGQPPVTSVPAGSTRAAQVFDFRAQSQRLIDAALGDEALVVQSASVPLPGTSYLYQAASAAAPTPPDFTVHDGVAETVSVVLHPIAEQGLFRADWRLTEFERYLAAMSPAAVPVAHRLTITGAPFAGTTPSPLFQGVFPETRNPTLFFLLVPAGAPDLTLPDLAYGRGFLPPSFVEMRAATFRARLELLAPGATTPLTSTLTMNRVEAAAGAPEVVVPALTPARQPLVNGLDAFQPQTSVGETPTLSWTAPEVGVPTSYQVAIYRLGSYNGASVLYFAAILFTTGTSFQVPAGFLSAGNSYVATILARDIPGESLTVPYRQTWVLSNANLMTAPFTP